MFHVNYLIKHCIETAAAVAQCDDTGGKKKRLESWPSIQNNVTEVLFDFIVRVQLVVTEQ
jgi:hypothetical protein